MGESGYIYEIFASIQGEGGSARGSAFGRHQVFVRFSGCNLPLIYGHGCVWCDTKKAWDMRTPHATVYTENGVEEIRNPMTKESVIKYVLDLKKKSTHSVSITGGEPLLQPVFLNNLIKTLHSHNISVFLETNATLPDNLAKITEHVDIVSADIKDRTAIPKINWEKIMNKEVRTIEEFYGRGSRVYAKYVVTEGTEDRDVICVCKSIDHLDIDLVIQPAFGDRISLSRVLGIMNRASEILGSERVVLSVQIHKLLEIP